MILRPAWRPDLSWLGRVTLAAVALGILAWTPRSLAQDTKPSAGDDAGATAVPGEAQSSPAKPSTEERLDRLEQMLQKVVAALEAQSKPAAGSFIPREHQKQLPPAPPKRTSGPTLSTEIIGEFKLDNSPPLPPPPKTPRRKGQEGDST